MNVAMQVRRRCSLFGVTDIKFNRTDGQSARDPDKFPDFIVSFRTDTIRHNVTMRGSRVEGLWKDDGCELAVVKFLVVAILEVVGDYVLRDDLDLQEAAGDYMFPDDMALLKVFEDALDPPQAQVVHQHRAAMDWPTVRRIVPEERDNE